jgi:hypothetical protein
VAWPKNQKLAVERIAIDPEGWASDMAEQIKAIALMTGEPYHRWFDSGDLQSAEMLAATCRVAELLPEIRFWLPTREVAMVRSYAEAGGKVPNNLVIRISAPMIDQGPTSGWPHTSTVHKTRELAEHEHACPARKQGNSCGECRACWSPDVASVSYTKH